MTKRVGGKSYTDIAKDIAPYLNQDPAIVRIYVHRWLTSTKVPSQKSLTAIYKAGYPIEPFVFGKEKWGQLKKGKK